MDRLNETAQEWVPHVRRLRPDMAWEDVLRIINDPLPHDRRWTQGRLLRAVKAYARRSVMQDRRDRACDHTGITRVASIDVNKYCYATLDRTRGRAHV